MYKKLQYVLIILSLAVVIFLSMESLYPHLPGLMGGSQQTFMIDQTKGNVKNELLKLAEAHHVSFAKRFVLPDAKAPEGMSYTYEQIGNVKLPSYLPIQKSQKVIKESPDTTNYVVVGKGYTAKQAVSDLDKSGNHALSFSLDNTFTVLRYFISEPPLWYIFLILLFIYITLLLAEYVSVIKKDRDRAFSRV